MNHLSTGFEELSSIVGGIRSLDGATERKLQKAPVIKTALSFLRPCLLADTRHFPRPSFLGDPQAQLQPSRGNRKQQLSSPLA